MAQDRNLGAEEQIEAFKELTVIDLAEFLQLFEKTFELPPGSLSAAPAVPTTTRTDLPKAIHSRLLRAAVNMERSVEALGPLLAKVEPESSPQLARSMQATENVWRSVEHEFGLLSSIEVSKAVGSKSPNRSYASEQRALGRLLAIKRPGGFKYPGFQIDRAEHVIRPLIHDLKVIADAAGRSEGSLALWMVSSTGYLDGARPVDCLDDPETVVEAARQSFNVKW